MNALLDSLERRGRAGQSLVLQGSDEQLDTARLTARVADFESHLRRLDIRRLAVVADNAPNWIVADLACQLAAVPLVGLPVYFSDRQLAHGLDSAGIDAVLTDDPARIGSLVKTRPTAWRGNRRSGYVLLRLADRRDLRVPAGTGKITFTSGTTGAPKGVCLSSANQERVVESIANTLDISSPRHLCLLPLSTLLENVAGVHHAILTGGQVILPSLRSIGLSGGNGLQALELLQTIERHQPTSMILTPQMLVALVAALTQGWTPPPSLQFAAVGGAVTAAFLIGEARRFGLPVYEGYGLSETGSVACLNRPGADRPGTVGKPLPHVRVSVEHGEIVIRGNTFLGYLDDVSSWFGDTVRTGDLGNMDDEGFVRVTGRRKNVMISSSGRNISPEWIEGELLAGPVISNCHVFGDSRPWCVAAIETRDPDCADDVVQQWINSVNARLPDYARIVAWRRLDDAARSPVIGSGRRAAARAHLAPIIDDLYTQLPPGYAP